MSTSNELEKVNWNLVKHYVFQAENALNAMRASYSGEVRQQRLFEVALRYMLQAQQLVDHCLTGRQQQEKQGDWEKGAGVTGGA